MIAFNEKKKNLQKNYLNKKKVWVNVRARFFSVAGLKMKHVKGPACEI